MRDLPRQLSADELAELFEGRTLLVERLAQLEDPLGRAREIARTLTDEEKKEVLDAHPAIGARRLSKRSAAERAESARAPIAGWASSTSFFSSSVSCAATSRARPSGFSRTASRSTKRVRPSKSAASSSTLSCRGSSRTRTTR